MWHDIAAAGETDYNDWHTREHMPERVGIPGFLIGRRYVDWNLTKYRYFTMYEGHTLATFNSAPYLERLNAPTAWTNRIQPHFRNMVRAACATVVSTGHGIGGALLTARIDFTDHGSAAFVAACSTTAAQIGGQHGVTGVHVGVADPSITSARTAETQLRKDVAESVYDGVLLVEGIGRRELDAARGCVENLLTPQVGVARSDVAIYDLAFLLTQEQRA